MKHAFKELKYNWKKYLLVEVLIIMLIFMVVFLTGLADGLGKAMSSGIELLNTESIVLKSDAEKMIGVSSLNETDVTMIKTNDSQASPISIQHSLVQTDQNGEKLDVTYFVIESDGILNPDVAQGESLGKTPLTIVVDKSLSQTEIEIGSTLHDTESGLDFKIVGITEGHHYSHTPVAYITYDSYAQMLNEINPDATIKVSAMIPSKEISNIEGFEVLDKTLVIENMPGYLAEQLTIKMIIWVLVIVSAAILAVFFYILTLQKTTQFGVLKAIGFSMTSIAKIQLAQIVTIAVSAGIVGYLLALGLASSLPSTMPFYVNHQALIIITASFIILSILSSMISIINIAKVDPVRIIGGSDE